jgi:hypothetical protein
MRFCYDSAQHRAAGSGHRHGGTAMSLLDTILNANDGKAIGQIAKQLGIPEPLANKAASSLAPALARGLQRNASQPGGLESLLGALRTGNHERYVDQPESLEREETVEDGNKILGHILGSKDVSRNVAGNASQQTGIDASTLKKMLPMLGAVAMGALSKQTKSGGELGALGGGQAGAAGNAIGMLSGFLDSDKDGSATDDVLNLARKFF